MIRRAAEIRSVTINGSKRTNGHAGDWYDDVINHDMELDDPPVGQNGWDKMDTESTHDSQSDYNSLLQETIQYGQVLQAEFEHDPRREIQKSLTDAFALLAYEDPINSKEVSHLLRRDGRVSVAEELNAAILGIIMSPPLPTFIGAAMGRSRSLIILYLTNEQSLLESPQAPHSNALYNKLRCSSTTSARQEAQELLLISVTT
jgi:hypothetical protein